MFNLLDIGFLVVMLVGVEEGRGEEVPGFVSDPVGLGPGEEGPLDPSGWGEVIPVPVPSGEDGPLVPSGWGEVIPVPVPSGEDGPLVPSG